jgi:outer membrane protein assembly complex protein YaeT
VSVRIDCDARLGIERFAGQITQKVGQPLEQSKVAESLKRLYATGRFRELRTDVEPKGNGVELIFAGRAVYFVGVVEVEGTPKPLDARALSNAARLPLGQPLAQDELAEATQRIAAVLIDNGYFQAQVRHRLIPDPDDQEATVVFSIVSGRPARLRLVEFQGQTVVPPARLGTIARWGAGRHMTSPRIERGLSRIHKFYVGQGRLQATTNIQKRVFDPQTQTETMVVQVRAGPLIRLHVEDANISRSKLRELLPMFRDGLVDDTTLEQGERILEDYFQRRRYFSAAVKAIRVSHPESESLDITYDVTLGKRGEFAGYGFRGNATLSTRNLEAAITEGSTEMSRGLNVFSRQLMERHTNSITRFYQSQGFLEARVTPHVDDHYGDQPGHVFVTFEIEEGPRTKVGRVMFPGMDQARVKEIWPLLLSKPGEPYSPEHAQADRAAILADLGDRGYPRATASWEASPVSPAHEVDLQYRVDPGPQERIERVVLLGNQHTRNGTIRRELGFSTGRPLSQSELLESQRRLYGLGVFNQVQVATQDPQSPETDKTVLVDVEETRRWTLGYGGGLEVQRLGSNQPQGEFKASPRLSLDLTRLNVGGRAQTLTLRGRLSNLETGGAMDYSIAHLPTARDVRLRFNALTDRSRDVLTFTAIRQEVSVSVEDHFSPAALLLGRFSFRKVRVDLSTLQISPQAIPLLSRPARIAMFGMSYITDRRDNPADATEGSYVLADAGISWDKLESEANFLRFSGQHASYYRWGSHLVFARNTRLQVESPFGSLIPTTTGNGQVILTHDIPLPERFFMGGSESHRGFSINQAGPRDLGTGFPIGGNALFFNSLELRTHALKGRIGFALFHDAGNVYSTIRKMRLLKFTQRSPTDFDYTVHAVGFGVRYKTPVGPLRFDLGYNLNPPRFQVIHTEIPGSPVEVRQLSRFQFFLSIGQSF